jgi:flagellar hook-basal body complex protein FliE
MVVPQFQSCDYFLSKIIPENKLKMDDLKFMDQTGNDQDQDQNQDDQNQDTGRQEQEMTENGGDHNGFKQELQEELDKLSQKENAAEQKTNE